MALHKLAKLNDTANLELVLKHSNECAPPAPSSLGSHPISPPHTHTRLSLLACEVAPSSQLRATGDAASSRNEAALRTSSRATSRPSVPRWCLAQ
eukprot:6206349-Pleurochrysis_carterae.AAC.1